MIPLRVMPRMGADLMVAWALIHRIMQRAAQRTARRARRTTVCGRIHIMRRPAMKLLLALGLLVAMLTPTLMLAHGTTRIPVIGVDASRTPITSMFESRRRAMPSSPPPISISSRRKVHTTAPGRNFSQATMVMVRHRRITPIGPGRIYRRRVTCCARSGCVPVTMSLLV